MPTGGVTLEYDNLKSWFDSGVTCVGMGSKLISKEIIANNDFTLLKDNVQRTLEIIKSLR
jgi:2-dehydro-3-deoxyphosphogluconate aldolase/(4S)-4-hydroxy-2-oxoglutarate aldolase